MSTLVLAIGCLVSTTSMATSDNNIEPDDSRIVVSKLADYGKEFQEITFFHLQGPDDVFILHELPDKLGQGASNVDYEHPESARKLLLEAQIARIEQMLIYKMPSATLFKSGKNSSFQTPYVCVITLNINYFLFDKLASTRFITGMENLSAANFPAGAALDNRKFLHFTVDHEVFHCLDAYLTGATRPRTQSQLTASYNDYRAEVRADVYAALRQRNSGSNLSFLLNLANFRALTIKDWDITHYTTPALQHVQKLTKRDISSSNTTQTVKSAMLLANKLILSRDRYAHFVASAAEVALSYGSDEAMLSVEFTEADKYGYVAVNSMIKDIQNNIVRAERHISPSLADN
jgi:hypothetical protein